MPSENNRQQAVRLLTTIFVKDDRGTSMAITLFISGNMLTHYIDEIIQLWHNQWGGQADHVFVTQGHSTFEWIKPGEMKDQQPHQP